jgi:hypothetical protein
MENWEGERRGLMNARSKVMKTSITALAKENGGRH